MTPSGERWLMLEKTTPSGKVLYRCTSCGRESPLPDRYCIRAGCGFDSEEERAAAERKAKAALEEALSWHRREGL